MVIDITRVAPPRRSVLLLPLVALLLALACAPVSSGGDPGEEDASPPEAGAAVGDRVPEFSLGLAEGGTLTSAELLEQGQPVFLFFFTTW